MTETQAILLYTWMNQLLSFVSRIVYCLAQPHNATADFYSELADSLEHLASRIRKEGTH